MYEITRTDYGFHLIFRGKFDAVEAANWLSDFREAVDQVAGEFLVFVDMRNLIPLGSESKELMQAGQEYARLGGMVRSVVILSSPVIVMQFKAIAAQSGIFDHERYIDATTTDDWEALGMGWLLHSQDPYKVLAGRT